MMHRHIILFASCFACAVLLNQTVIAQTTQEEFGKCGYYADALQGRKTASGEKYDKNLLTCAHKTLPFGTQVRVTRMDNGKSVIVRVNDRGPYIDGYATDVSRKAAEAIGLVRDGVTRVKLTVVSDASAAKSLTVSNRVLPKELEPVTYSAGTTLTASKKAQLLKSQKSTAKSPVTYSTISQVQPTPLTAAPPAEVQVSSELFQMAVIPVDRIGFGLQIAVLTTPEKLFQEVSKIQAIWPGKVVVNHEEVKDLVSTTYKLILGPYATRKEAEAQQKKAALKGYKKSFVVDLSQ